MVFMPWSYVYRKSNANNRLNCPRFFNKNHTVSIGFDAMVVFLFVRDTTFPICKTFIGNFFSLFNFNVTNNNKVASCWCKLFIVEINYILALDVVKCFFGHYFTIRVRSEEHTSELQSRPHLVCRLLFEKKKNKYLYINTLF